MYPVSYTHLDVYKRQYETRPDDLDADKVKWLDEHPDFNLNTERENAARVAQAMKLSLIHI